MSKASPPVNDVRVWLPARDFARSLAFHKAIGWQVPWQSDGLAVLQLGDTRVMLQDHFVTAWAHNAMVTIDVPDATSWFDHVRAVVATGEHEPARVNPPEPADFCELITHVWDPSGVLLHFVQFG